MTYLTDASLDDRDYLPDTPRDVANWHHAQGQNCPFDCSGCPGNIAAYEAEAEDAWEHAQCRADGHPLFYGNWISNQAQPIVPPTWVDGEPPF
jgi:hypothetical protein